MILPVFRLETPFYSEFTLFYVENLDYNCYRVHIPTAI